MTDMPLHRLPGGVREFVIEKARDEAQDFREALEAIAGFDAETVAQNGVYDEWAESEGYHAVKKIAADILKRHP